MASSASACPCGSGAAEAACCGRWIASGQAPTAQALMRSRYTAYVRGEIAYLVDTHDESTRSTVDVRAVEQWSRETQWRGIVILDVVRGAETDDDGVVEFVARGVTKGTPFAHRERSRFRRVDGRWYYVDGKVSAEPAKRVETVGRNEPCPCGSGMKYKRCHGA